MSAPPISGPVSGWAQTLGALIEAQAGLAAASLDRLTGVLARPAWEALAGQWIARPQNGLLVVFVDLDGLKQVNDTLGHTAGDLLLSETGRRLLAFLRRRTGCAGRWGGDEFVLLLPGGHAADLADLVELLDRPVPRWAAAPLPAGASIGAVYADRLATRTLPSVIAAAERAMYAHKRARGSGRP